MRACEHKRMRVFIYNTCTYIYRVCVYVQSVRAQWQPKEYPQSLERLYQVFLSWPHVLLLL